MAAEPHAPDYLRSFQALLRTFETKRRFRVSKRTLIVEAKPKINLTFATRFSVNDVLQIRVGGNQHLTFEVSFSDAQDLVRIQPNWIWRTIGPAFIAPSTRPREMLVAILRTCMTDINYLEQNPGKSLRGAEKVLNDIRSVLRP